MKKLIYILFLFGFLGTSQISFPSAVGFGQNAVGGRGGDVIFVTNLNNSGSGSLRAAIESNGARTIIFRVAGYIDLTSPLIISNPNITIAGETSPGGISIRNYGISIRTSQVIIRHIRVRHDGTIENQDGINIVAYSAYQISNVIIDHCSISWAEDENMSINPIASGSSVRNVTIQNCLIAEAMGSSRAFLMMNNIANVSFIKNYLSNNADRQFHPSTCGIEFEVVNNVIYNYIRGTEVAYGSYADVIGNIYKNGSNVAATGQALRYQTSGNSCYNGSSTASDGSTWESDNTIIDGYGLKNGDWTTYSNGSRINTDSPYTPISSVGLDSILTNVGANLWPDSIDTRNIGYYSSGGGNIISSPSSVGGFPTITSGTPYVDDDGDGMGDDWENARWGDLDEYENGDDDGDGYTNLEEFLHYMAGDGNDTSQGPGNDVDGVGVEPSTLTLEVGETMALVKTVSPITALDQTGTWSSSNTGLATVDSSGNVTGVSDSPDEVTDGDFSSAANWTIHGESTISGGVARIYSPTNIFSYIQQNDVLTVGKTYVLTYEITSYNGGFLSSDNLDLRDILTEDVGMNTIKFTATTGNTFLMIKRYGVTDITIDNVAIKELPLVTFTTTDGGFTDSAEITVLPVEGNEGYSTNQSKRTKKKLIRTGF
jgi:uncharacterized protein YjdB